MACPMERSAYTETWINALYMFQTLRLAKTDSWRAAGISRRPNVHTAMMPCEGCRKGVILSWIEAGRLSATIENKTE